MGQNSTAVASDWRGWVGSSLSAFQPGKGPRGPCPNLAQPLVRPMLNQLHMEKDQEEKGRGGREDSPLWLRSP